MPQSVPLRPSIALAAFAERLVDGRRILVFGNALSSFWEQLIERGARLVHVCDSDTTRVSEAAARNTSQHVSFAPLGGAGLAVRDGAFDVGFVENLAVAADPAATLHRLKRALSARGTALVAAPNPDVDDALIACSNETNRTLDYYSLYDLVHREFPVVRMAGQMPFVGYTVAELAPSDEPDPCLDAGFVPGGTEEPEWFVAIASHSDVQFESYLVVQLPHNQLTKGGSERLLREQLRGARSAERSAVERLSRLEAEQRRWLDIAQRHQKDVDLARQIRLLQEELERKESWILQLEARAATADARADEADQQLEEFRTRVDLESQQGVPPFASLEEWQKTIERLELEKCDLVGKLTAAESQRTETEQRLSLEHNQLADRLRQAETSKLALEQQLVGQKTDLSGRLAFFETTRVEVERQLAAANQRAEDVARQFIEEDEAHLAELSELEGQLRERGERIRQLELDLKRTEELGARLIRELTRAQSLAAAAPDLNAMAQSSVAQVAMADCRPVPDLPITGGPIADETVSTVATESWTQSPTVTTPASTRQSAEQASAWTEPTPIGPVAPATDPTGAEGAPELEQVPTSAATDLGAAAEIEALRTKLDALAALATKQQADLVASEWRMQQLLRENGDLSQQASKAKEISSELALARERLQQTEVLLNQVAAHHE